MATASITATSAGVNVVLAPGARYALSFKTLVDQDFFGGGSDPRLSRALVIFVRFRIAEIDRHPIPDAPGDKTGEPANRVGDAVVIRANHLAQILGVQPRRQRGQADQFAEHHGQLAPLGLRSCGIRGW